METKLIEVDNDTLKQEYKYFLGIGPKSKNESLRQTYIQELEKIFNTSDRNHDGKIDRKEFERLI